MHLSFTLTLCCDACFLVSDLGLEGSSGEFNDLDNIIASITNLEITPENIRCFLPQVDWERLASMYVMGRSGAECETRYLYRLSVVVHI